MFLIVDCFVVVTGPQILIGPVRRFGRIREANSPALVVVTALAVSFHVVRILPDLGSLGKVFPHCRCRHHSRNVRSRRRHLAGTMDSRCVCWASSATRTSCRRISRLPSFHHGQCFLVDLHDQFGGDSGFFLVEVLQLSLRFHQRGCQRVALFN